MRRIAPQTGEAEGEDGVARPDGGYQHHILFTTRARVRLEAIGELRAILLREVLGDGSFGPLLTLAQAVAEGLVELPSRGKS